MSSSSAVRCTSAPITTCRPWNTNKSPQSTSHVTLLDKKRNALPSWWSRVYLKLCTIVHASFLPDLDLRSSFDILNIISVLPWYQKSKYTVNDYWAVNGKTTVVCTVWRKEEHLCRVSWWRFSFHQTTTQRSEGTVWLSSVVFIHSRFQNSLNCFFFIIIFPLPLSIIGWKQYSSCLIWFCSRNSCG